MQDTPNIIEVKDLSFSFNSHPVLKNINLTVKKADYLGLIGPNGSGKTTLLKLMLGLIKPKEGEIKIYGHDIKEFRDWSKIGYVSQRATKIDLNFPATVNEVVSMGRFSKTGLFRMPNKDDQKHVDEAMEKVEMTKFKDRLIADLSGGQQQRVFIARALASNPEILFLDEPTVGVDTETQDEFYALLKKLNQELGLTIILVSHDIDSVAHETKEILYLNQKIIYCGPPKKFIEHIH